MSRTFLRAPHARFRLSGARRTAISASVVAAGIACLISGRSANAALVTRNVNTTLIATNLVSYNLDVDQNGTTDLTFDADYVPDPVLSVGFDQIEFPFGSSNGVVVDAATGDGFPTVSLLGPGSVVSAASVFSSSNDKGDLYYNDTVDPVTGNFAGKTGYVGFRFTTPAGLSYGYAQVTVDSINDPTNPLGLTIGSVTYNTTPNQPVTVPEPGSIAAMGLLAIAGLVRR
jgi:hypothetical protein